MAERIISTPLNNWKSVIFFLGSIQQNIISDQCPSNQTIKLLKYSSGVLGDHLGFFSESFDVWRDIDDVK